MNGEGLQMKRRSSPSVSVLLQSDSVEDSPIDQTTKRRWVYLKLQSRVIENEFCNCNNQFIQRINCIRAQVSKDNGVCVSHAALPSCRAHKSSNCSRGWTYYTHTKTRKHKHLFGQSWDSGFRKDHKRRFPQWVWCRMYGCLHLHHIHTTHKVSFIKVKSPKWLKWESMQSQFTLYFFSG